MRSMFKFTSSKIICMDPELRSFVVDRMRVREHSARTFGVMISPHPYFIPEAKCAIIVHIPVRNRAVRHFKNDGCVG